MAPAPAVDAHPEREAKLAAWPGFELPDLDGVFDGCVAEVEPEAVLDATYVDTADLRLIRAGITLRHRTGEGPGPRWTLKLPAGDFAELADRTEIDVAADPSTGPEDTGPVPASLEAIVSGHVRTAPLRPVARLQTRRRKLVLRSGGQALAEVDDDEVSVLDGERLAARFREVEVEEVAEAPDGLLAAVVDRLEAAGAGASDQAPKLVRALGPRALAPPELHVAELPADPLAGEVVRAALVASARRLLDHLPVVHLDQHPEGVHQARVGTRRLRSDLKTFGPLLDEAATSNLRDELRWLGEELGAVRDLDVLGERLRQEVGALGPAADPAGVADLLGVVAAERDEAQAALVEHLCGDRARILLDRLVTFATSPRFATDDADRRAAKALPALVGRPHRKLQRAVRALDDEPADEELHEVRKKAKQARYAIEAVAPIVGSRARKAAKRVAALQEVLGDHQDAIVAQGWLQAHLDGASPATAYVVGLLVAAEERTAEEGRAGWRKAWAGVEAADWSWLG